MGDPSLLAGRAPRPLLNWGAHPYTQANGTVAPRRTDANKNKQPLIGNLLETEARENDDIDDSSAIGRIDENPPGVRRPLCPRTRCDRWFRPGGLNSSFGKVSIARRSRRGTAEVEGEGSSGSRPLGPPTRTDDRNVFDTIGDDYHLQDLARYGLLPTYRRYLPSIKRVVRRGATVPFACCV